MSTNAPETPVTREPDFKVEFVGGNLFLLRPLNPACREWLRKNVDPETSAWWGGALAVHPSQVDNTVNALIEHEFSPAS